MLFASREGREASAALVSYSGLGCSLAAGIAVLTWLGHLVDQRLGSDPTGLIVGFCLGAGGGLYKLVRDVTRLSAEQDRAEGIEQAGDAGS